MGSGLFPLLRCAHSLRPTIWFSRACLVTTEPSRGTDALLTWFVSSHPFQPSFTRAVMLVDLAGGIQLLIRSTVVARCHQRAAPILECFGLLEWHLVAAED